MTPASLLVLAARSLPTQARGPSASPPTLRRARPEYDHRCLLDAYCMDAYCHRIADLGFRTESDVALPHLQAVPFAHFAKADAAVDVRVRIQEYSLDALGEAPLDSSERPLLLRTLDFPPRWLDSPALRHPGIRAAVRRCLGEPEMAQIEFAWDRPIVRNYGRGEYSVFYRRHKRTDLAGPLFAAGFRNLLGPALAPLAAAMVHGAGVVRRGVAAVFLAEDEGGKSSVATMPGAGRILNDDHLILRRSRGKVIAHATPLGPCTSGPAQAPVGGLFVLEKAAAFDLQPIGSSEALQFLWEQHRCGWAVLPGRLLAGTFELLHALCRQAPAFRMRFPKGWVDWGAVDAALAR